MLTSLFGDLNIAKSVPDDTLPADSGLIRSDGGFAATAILESSAAEVNDQGQIVDRHLRDLVITGSPARAMREHFATSRAELEYAGKWIVLLDPARVWAGAMVKALSDASGQPIDRLQLRAQGTLRTLAMIERTSIVRRLDETLKVYHADVRASGRENAEISLAMMERAHLTTVIVGPMQPYSIDSLLTTLQEAVVQPTWRCPALLFLLPPSAVWIANKIAGIGWPEGLSVQVLNEPLTGASAVWNAVLAVWNRVKDDRSAWEAAPPATGVGPYGFPIKVAELASSAGVVSGPTVQAQSYALRGLSPLDRQQASQALTEALRADGLLTCAVVDSATGAVLAQEQRDGVLFDMAAAAAAAAQVLRAHRLAARNLALHEHIEEVMVSAGSRQQVMRVLSRHPELFLFAVLDKHRTNLALVRFRLLEAEKNLF